MYWFESETVARRPNRGTLLEQNPIFRLALEPNCLLPPALLMVRKSRLSSKSTSASTESIDFEKGLHAKGSALLPSMRLLVAFCLCLVYMTVSVSSSNIAVALICMIRCEKHGYFGTLEWNSAEEGLLLAAQNIGSLLMLVTGVFADRFNGKWMVCFGLSLCLVGNVSLPLLAEHSFWYAFASRTAIGASDAFVAPAISSLITRWFPYNERAVAIGCITGGRQLGTLLILPTAGALCQTWPLIFHLSALVTAFAALLWLPLGADKPAKQWCMPNGERIYIESRIACEHIGKRTQKRPVPWRRIMRSVPLWANVFALICHEYPLVIMLQFLPNYMRDVLEMAPARNGLLSALPILFLLASKWISSSLSSWISSRGTTLDGDGRSTRRRDTLICKTFNAIASLGLALCIGAVPQFGREQAHWAVVALCCAMAFAGFHTPGVQTALLQLAPPFSGVLTGISFFAVSWFSILNKVLTKRIVQSGSHEQWSAVFYVSAVIAALPMLFFSVWGSDQVQPWARSTLAHGSQRSNNSIASMASTTTQMSTREHKNSAKEEKETERL